MPSAMTLRANLLCTMKLSSLLDIGEAWRRCGEHCIYMLKEHTRVSEKYCI